MTYPNGTRVSVSNTPNVENGEIGFVTGYVHHTHLLQVQFKDRTVFCGAENCYDTGRSKDEKIKEVMAMVLKWGIEVSLTGEANFMATRIGASADDIDFHKESVARMQSAREAIEAKLRQLIQ